MIFTTRKMTSAEADIIVKWEYQEPYSIYNMDESCRNELINGYYYYVSTRESNLIGYYCFGESAQVPAGNLHGVYNDQNYIDIGLGIEPTFCGQGLGLEFLRNGL